MRYEIDNDNAIKVFNDDSDVPFLFQPKWPNGDSWLDASEASMWAELYIASATNESAPYVPLGRGMAGRPKMSAEKRNALNSALYTLANAKNPEEYEAAKINVDSVINS
jgi:hypothetical protein